MRFLLSYPLFLLLILAWPPPVSNLSSFHNGSISLSPILVPTRLSKRSMTNGNLSIIHDDSIGADWTHSVKKRDVDYGDEESGESEGAGESDDSGDSSKTEDTTKPEELTPEQKELREAENNAAKLLKNFTETSKKLEKKKEEAKAANTKYLEATAAWDKLEKMYNESKLAEKALEEWEQADEADSEADTTLNDAIRDRDLANETLILAQEKLVEVRGEPARQIAAKEEKAKCETLQKTLRQEIKDLKIGGKNTTFKQAKSKKEKYDEKVDQAGCDKPDPDQSICETMRGVQDTNKKAFDNAESELRIAQEQAETKTQAITNCTKKLRELNAEIYKLDANLQDQDRIGSKEREVKAAEKVVGSYQEEVDKAKKIKDKTAETLREKKAAKEATEGASSTVDQKAIDDARDARDNAKTEKDIVDKRVKKLKKTLAKVKGELDQANKTLETLKQRMKKDEPSTGTVTIIGISVTAVLIVLAICGVVAYLYIKRRNHRILNPVPPPEPAKGIVPEEQPEKTSDSRSRERVTDSSPTPSVPSPTPSVPTTPTKSAESKPEKPASQKPEEKFINNFKPYTVPHTGVTHGDPIKISPGIEEDTDGFEPEANSAELVSIDQSKFKRNLENMDVQVTPCGFEKHAGLMKGAIMAPAAHEGHIEEADCLTGVSPSPSEIKISEEEKLLRGEKLLDEGNDQNIDAKLKRADLVDLLSNMTKSFNKRYPLKSNLIFMILWKAREVFKDGMNALAYSDLPAAFIGDTHGQFGDVIRALTMLSGGRGHEKIKIGRRRIVLLGDYVDRGNQQTEVVTAFLILKILYPKHVVMLRGNHETREINRRYGFAKELTKRFGKEKGMELWEMFNEVFDHMPLACRFGGVGLAMHGGISDKLGCMQDIIDIKLPLRDPRKNELALDLLWADPMLGLKGFIDNLERHMSKYFGEDALIATLERLNLKFIIRGHQVMQNGVGIFGNERRCISVFTAASVNEYKNRGAVLIINEKLELTVLEIWKKDHPEETLGHYNQARTNDNRNHRCFADSRYQKKSGASVRSSRVPKKEADNRHGSEVAPE